MIEKNFNSLAKDVEYMKLRDEEIVNTMDSLVERIRDLHNIVDGLSERSVIMHKRITLIDNELSERTLRRKMFTAFLAFYPVIILAILFMVDSDHHKIKEIATDVHELIGDTRDLVGKVT